MNILLYVNDANIPENIPYPGVPEIGNMIMYGNSLLIVENVKENTPKDSEDDPDFKVYAINKDQARSDPKYNEFLKIESGHKRVSSFLEQHKEKTEGMSLAQILESFYGYLSMTVDRRH